MGRRLLCGAQRRKENLPPVHKLKSIIALNNVICNNIVIVTNNDILRS